MRNLFNKASAAAIAVATAAVLSAGSANAQGATVFIDEDIGACSVFDGAGGLVLLTAADGAVLQAVLTPSGNIKLTCNGKIAVGAPQRAVFYSSDDLGIPCGTIFGPADEWQEVVTKSGRVSLTCHFNAQQ